MTCEPNATISPRSPPRGSCGTRGRAGAALTGFGAAVRERPQTGSDEPITSWAIGLDLYLAQPGGTFGSLLQTADGDGDLFLRDNGDGAAGIGIDGVYQGAVPFDAWPCIVATFTQEGGNTILRTYVDGALV